MRDFSDARPQGGATIAAFALLSALSACAGDGQGAVSAPLPHEVSVIHPSTLPATAPAIAPRTQPVQRSFAMRAPDSPQATERPALRAAYIQALQATAGVDYQPQQSGSELVLLKNPRHGLSAELLTSGARFLVESADARHSAALRLFRYGCAGDDAARSEAIAAARPIAAAKRAMLSRPTITEWYQSGPLGIEQGFELATRPACAGSGIVLQLELESDLKPRLVDRDGQPAIELRDEKGRTALRYSDLFAFDDAGRSLAATMGLSGKRLTLSIDDDGARYPLHVDPLIWAQLGSEIKATNPPPAMNDAFGTAIAASGDIVVVGAPFTDEGATADVGSAFVFQRGMNGGFTQQLQIVPSVVNAGAHFGQAVAVGVDTASGNKRIVVGAPDDGTGGTASFFLFSGTTATLEYTATGATGDKLGGAVGVSNDRVIVGAPGAMTSDGYAAIFEPVSLAFSEVKSFPGVAGSGERYGFAVAIDGDLAVAGVPLRDMPSTDGGGYDAFLRKTGVWTLTQSLGSTGNNRQAGSALAISGSAVLDGIIGDGGTGTAFVDDFDLMTGLNSGSSQLTLPTGTLQTGDMFGNAVAISGTLAVVGAAARNGQTGDAFVFEKILGNWTYQPPAASRKTPMMNERFGQSVAVQNGGGQRYVVVGAPGNDTTAAKSGAFYEIIERLPNGQPCGKDGDCASDFCIDDVCCNSACGRMGGGSAPKSDCQSCLGADTGGSDGTCAALNIRQQCRGAVDLCDRPAFCVPGNMVCPSNAMATAGKICRAATGPCDAAEVCDGLNSACPVDAKQPMGFVCRPAAGDCDLAETCDGTSPACPTTDAKQPIGTPCRVAAPTDVCDVTEACAGGNDCPADSVQAAGSPCRAAKDECDLGESCDGRNKSCPFDASQVDGYVCAAGTCQGGNCREEADLELVLSANPPVTQHQDVVTFTAVVQNRGPSASSAIELRFSANDGGQILSADGSGFSCQFDDKSATCTLATLPNDQGANLKVQVKPPLQKRQFSLSSVVAAMTYDPQLGNNHATTVVPNENPQIPVLAGGGIGCSAVPHTPIGPAPAIVALALALLALRRRRTA